MAERTPAADARASRFRVPSLERMAFSPFQEAPPPDLNREQIHAPFLLSSSKRLMRLGHARPVHARDGQVEWPA